jgi:hypothetical protein
VANLNDEILQKRLNVGITTRDVIEKGLMEAYSQWFEGRRYAGEMVHQGQAAFESYMGGLIEERHGARAVQENGLDRYIRKYKEQKKRKYLETD